MLAELCAVGATCLRREKQDLLVKALEEKCESLPRGKNLDDLGCSENILFPFNREQKQGALLTPMSGKKVCVQYIGEMSRNSSP